ncbi:LysR family transcriptional regulator [uncultured Paracoccus sp.]|uniref:LysR family transcriptional regulator n=1 Tax=uncultured Paracoccus sp. TaxID=189685 RepID=UPI00260EF8FA|nr:LysR family transcriptional regulator [uncultured Paracoccus sp.]
MDLRQLRNFVEICRLGSITSAAERLNVAQPALTRQVKALEHELGVTLLHRHGRGVSPTPEGEMLSLRGRDLLDQADQIVREVSGRDGELRGTVTLGLPPALAETIATPLIDRFLAEYPLCRLRIASGFTGHVRDWLQRGSIDVGVTYEITAARSPRATTLLQEHLYLIGPPGDGRTDEPVSFAEAFGKPLILPSPAHGLRQLIDLAAAARGLIPDVYLEVDIVSAMLNFVERGGARTILSLNSVDQRLRDGRVTARPITSPDLRRTLVLWLPEVQRSHLTRRFAEIIVSHIHDTVAAGAWKGALVVEPDAPEAD